MPLTMASDRASRQSLELRAIRKIGQATLGFQGQRGERHEEGAVTFRRCATRYPAVSCFRRVEVTIRRRIPMTVDELFRAGGPQALIREAERRAGDAEARFWLSVLETAGPRLDGAENLLLPVMVQDAIRSLRKRLGLKPRIDEVRAQTRERVRRFREKAKGVAGVL
jgi:hypothetical protein